MSDQELLRNSELQKDEKHPEEPGKKKFRLPVSGSSLIVIILCAVLLCVITFLAIRSIDEGTDAVKDAYADKKNEVAAKVYDSFYQKSYDISEEKHHVKNEVLINFGSLREESRLEVLRVSNVEYVTPESDEGKTFIDDIVDRLLEPIYSRNVVVWLEVPGNGIFTVDIKSSEFIFDNERRYVLLRIPSPELTEFSIDYANVALLNFKDGGLLKNPPKVGEDLAREQLQAAELGMRQEMYTNQRFYQSAKEAAVSILTSFVKELNPGISDLTVEVEFMD